MSPSLLSGGYVVLDVVQSDGAVWHAAGGTAANVAANLAYLGWNSAIIGRIGCDDTGIVAAHSLRSAGVDLSSLWLDRDTTTPLIRHEIKAGAHRYRFGCTRCGRGSAVYRPLPESPHAKNATLTDVFFFDRPSRVNLAIAERHQDAGACVVYEPSTRATVSAHERACAAASIIKFSAQRQVRLSDRLPERRPREMRIVTNGANGSTIEFGKLRIVARPPAVDATDGGGAGDWMTAGLLHRLGPIVESWDRVSITDAVEWSQTLAALSTTLPGARTLARVIPRHRLADRIRSVRRGSRAHLTFSLDVGRQSGLCSGCGLPSPGAM